ncbi:MAG: hypothetical protein E7616_01960 [Ruminococcaceae bacterium]|nr:hypothetical protein [Oscillospiraceae bacterium]
MWGSLGNNSIRIRVKPSAIAVWFCFLVFDPSIYTLLLFLSMLIHECGHLIALCICRVRKIRLVISAFGAEINYDGYLKSCTREIFVALGGVLANLISALPVLAFGRNIETCLFFAVASLTLVFLNLIPVKGLDGAKALESFLLFYKDPDTVFGIMKTVSLLCIALLFGLSVTVLMESGFNFSLLLLTLYLSLSILGK